MADTDIIESLRLAWVNDDMWPVFVFPDHSVPQGMIVPRPSPLHLPVLVLGQNNFIWSSPDDLWEFNPASTEHLNDPSADQERRKAFEDANQGHGMNHYHALVLSLQKESKSAVILVDSDDENPFKPDKPVQQKAQHAVFLEDSDDDMPVLLPHKPLHLSTATKRAGLVTPDPTPRKRQKPLPRPLATTRPDYGYDSDDEIILPPGIGFKPIEKAKKKLPELAADDYVGRKQLERIGAVLDQAEPDEAEELQPVNDPQKVNVFVGAEGKLFILDLDVIEKHPSIKEHIKNDDITGHTIRNATFKDISAKVVELVESWLHTSEYRPRLMDDRKPYLENVYSVRQFERSVEQSSLLWNAAHKLKLPDLQDLIYRKIESMRPMATNSLLILTRMVYWNPVANTEIDGKMRQMLKKEIASRLHEIIDEDALLFNRVVKSNVELASYIWQYQIDNPWVERSSS